MSFFTQLKFVFIWYKKLTKRFIDLALNQTIIVIIATLFSQIFVLLSSILPLKVIMLLGSDIVPGYLPESWQLLGRDTLILCFALAAIGFYILHLLCEKIIGKNTQQGSLKILQNNKKLVLFEKQDFYAQNWYTKQSKSLANIIFFALGLGAIASVYPLLGLVIIVVIALAYTSLAKIYSVSKRLDEQFGSYLKIIKDTGFFLIFVLIVAHFISGLHQPHVVVAILSVLLVRQMFSKLESAIKDITSLYKNRVKINSLFLFTHTNIAIDHSTKDSFWTFVENDDGQIEALLQKHFGKDTILESFEWVKVDIRNMAYIKIIASINSNKKTMMLKLYNYNISSQAIHETTILQECDIGLELIYSGAVDKLHYNLFEYENQKQINPAEYAKNLSLVKIKLIKIQPSSEIIQRYERSHQYLYQQLSTNICDRLLIVCTNNEKEEIFKLKGSFSKIISIVQQLPVQISNPIVTKGSIVIGKHGLSLLNWGSWKIDSIGADYPISHKSFEILRDQFFSCQKEREELRSVAVEDVVLTALMSQFYKFYIFENFGLAIELIPSILESIDKIRHNNTN